MSGNAALVIITEKQQEILKRLAAARVSQVQFAQRSKIILLAFEKRFNEDIAVQVGLERNQVGRWRTRWKESFHDLVAVECNEGKPELEAAIKKVLSDLPRKGRSSSTTSEQRAKVISVACESPEQSGVPISRWTSNELATEVIRRGILESISSSTIRRWLGQADLKPWKSEYWLFSPDRDTTEFDARVRLICEIYAESIEAYKDYGIHTICIDEQTGIQALERIAPDKPSLPGQCAKLEYEYKRHGTTCLFGNFHVATGELLSPMLSATRTEEDFAANLASIVKQAPNDRYRFIVDNLNTHCSESCVLYVAKMCGIDESTLGTKGRSGILKNMESRQAFLSNPVHRIHFYFLPRHSSWLNQIEIWFGILRRKVTRYGSFKSVENLNEKIKQFIDYYNDALAHPFQWTYRGKVLCV